MKKFTEWMKLREGVSDDYMLGLKRGIPDPVRTAQEIENALKFGDPDGILKQYYDGWSPEDLKKFVKILSEPGGGLPKPDVWRDGNRLYRRF